MRCNFGIHFPQYSAVPVLLQLTGYVKLRGITDDEFNQSPEMNAYATACLTSYDLVCLFVCLFVCCFFSAPFVVDRLLRVIVVSLVPCGKVLWIFYWSLT